METGEYHTRKVFMRFGDALDIGFAFGLGFILAQLVAAAVIGAVIGIVWAFSS